MISVRISASSTGIAHDDPLNMITRVVIKLMRTDWSTRGLALSLTPIVIMCRVQLLHCGPRPDLMEISIYPRFHSEVGNDWPLNPRWLLSVQEPTNVLVQVTIYPRSPLDRCKKPQL